jgi:hypothetical protein
MDIVIVGIDLGRCPARFAAHNRRRRAAWKRFEARIVPERLVFIDETWTKTNMFPRPWMVPARREASRQGSSWPLENPDLRGGVALRRHRCALRL